MIDEKTAIIAKMQANLFEYSCDMGECSSSFFIKQFLYSDLAIRMNDKNFIYSNDDIPYLYNDIKMEKKINVGKEIYPKHVMSWIGYLFAVMIDNHNLSPKQIYRIITPRELYNSYEAYHSLDIEDAANRIIESKTHIEKNDLELFKSTR